MWKYLLKIALFIAFVPGVLFRALPSSPMIVQVLAHGFLFLALMYVLNTSRIFEGFDNPSTKVDPPCPPDYVKCPSGDCRLRTDVHSPCS
jgi:hypothetical protein